MNNRCQFAPNAWESPRSRRHSVTALGQMLPGTAGGLCLFSDSGGPPEIHTWGQAQVMGVGEAAWWAGPEEAGLTRVPVSVSGTPRGGLWATGAEPFSDGAILLLQVAAARTEAALAIQRSLTMAFWSQAAWGEDLFSGVIHRLNNLLAAIEMHRGLLARLVPEAGQRYLQAIERQVARGVDLTGSYRTPVLFPGPAEQRDLVSVLHRAIALQSLQRRQLPFELGPVPSLTGRLWPLEQALVIGLHWVTTDAPGGWAGLVAAEVSGDGELKLAVCSRSASDQAVMHDPAFVEADPGLFTARLLLSASGGDVRAALAADGPRLWITVPMDAIASTTTRHRTCPHG